MLGDGDRGQCGGDGVGVACHKEWPALAYIRHTSRPSDGPWTSAETPHRNLSPAFVYSQANMVTANDGFVVVDHYLRQPSADRPGEGPSAALFRDSRIAREEPRNSTALQPDNIPSRRLSDDGIERLDLTGSPPEEGIDRSRKPRLGLESTEVDAQGNPHPLWRRQYAFANDSRSLESAMPSRQPSSQPLQESKSCPYITQEGRRSTKGQSRLWSPY